MTVEQIGGIVRAVLSAVGGYFVGKGVIDADMAAQLTGAGAVIATAIWSIIAKRQTA